ncbi:MAG: M56 family metallopeptidase, partial [Chitinophagaceae bacterium]|nr:M56 family metallopeptidase [Chitinophagaceae bacterium]
MADISQSALLQALGWATLNSFWQVALLWVIFLSLDFLFHFSPQQKYRLASAAICVSFIWFVYTIIIHFQNPGLPNSLFGKAYFSKPDVFNTVIISASTAYLLLLIFPVYRFWRNWQFIIYLKRTGLQKASVSYRLFVTKISAQLGIKKRVGLYISELVTSPVIIGYLKPMILLPIGAVNNLTSEQVEAVLLHELSHIKRYDYLINLFITGVYTLLYFNPFIKYFVKVAENEREMCCDELVLQFGYDKISYASALLLLEKTATSQAFAVAATGKKHLLSRIEKIVGVKKRPVLNFKQIAGLFAAAFLFLVVNSIILIKSTIDNNSIVFSPLSNSVFLFSQEGKADEPEIGSQKIQKRVTSPATTGHAASVAAGKVHHKVQLQQIAAEESEDDEVNDIIPVAFDEADAKLTEDEKEQVKCT